MQISETTIEELQSQLAEQHARATAQQTEVANLRQRLSDSQSEKSSVEGRLASAVEAYSMAAQVHNIIRLSLAALDLCPSKP